MWPINSNVRKLLQHNYKLVTILFLATALRFLNLSSPPTYIFDEVYHSFTAREYLHNHIEAWEWWTTPPEGVAYEWTHPPIAKYGMVLGMLLFGEDSLGWRIGSAAFGVASILGLYQLVLSLTKSKHVAILSAFLVSIEGLHISQSRVGMNDIYLLNFYIWSLYAAVKNRWKSAAVLYGLALGSKWSALYGVIPLSFIYLHQSHFPHWNLQSIIHHLLSALRYTLIAIFVYLLTFAPFILAGHSWAQFVELHRQMWYYHTHLVATHDYQSTPKEWIFAARPVWYHVDYQDNSTSNIYAQGNPIILWLGLAVLILQSVQLLRYPYSIIFASYLIFVIPWIISPRIMFFYHYLPSATFLCVLLAAWLSRLSTLTRNGLVILCCMGLVIVSPMLYNIMLPTHFWTNYFTLFPRWK